MFPIERGICSPFLFKLLSLILNSILFFLHIIFTLQMSEFKLNISVLKFETKTKQTVSQITIYTHM